MLLTPLLHGGEIWNAYLIMPTDGGSSAGARLEFESIAGSARKGLRVAREAPVSVMETLRRGAALDRQNLLEELERALGED